MGDTIKYQDDIEFLLSNSKSNDNTTVPINEYFKKTFKFIPNDY